MSSRIDDHPRYKPAKPTADQLRRMHEVLGNLTRAFKKPDGEVSPPQTIDDPAISAVVSGSSETI